MVQWLATDLMADHIRINAVSPGLIKTDFSGALWKKKDKDGLTN